MPKHPNHTGQKLDRTGIRYGSLTAIQPIRYHPKGWVWQYRCDCGSLIESRYPKPACSTKCSHHPKPKGGRPRGRDMNIVDHELYGVWSSMRNRCKNPNSPSYRYYGERGIDVDPRWDKFWNFVDDVGERPPGHQLDRIDTNGNYGPGNTRWATPADNARNTRACKYWYVDGKRYNSTKEAAKAHGVSMYTIRGWCMGVTHRSGNYAPPRENCWAEHKYQQT